MKIISDFKDYYDSGMAHGMDEKIVYLRKTETLKKKVFESFPRIPIEDTMKVPYAGETYGESFRWGANLCICGKGYPLFSRKSHAESNEEVSWYMAHQVIDKFKEWATYSPTKTRQSMDAARYFLEEIKERPRNCHIHQTVTEFRELNELYSGVPIDLKFFHEYEAPVFIVKRENEFKWMRERDITILTNPCLKDLEFFKIMDPYTCFQELQMFVGGVLANLNEKDQRAGDDKTIMKAHGFDDMSFKTLAPGHKKENRRLNRERKRGT